VESEAEGLPLALPPGGAKELLPAGNVRVHSPAPQQIAFFTKVPIFHRVLNHSLYFAHKSFTGAKGREVVKQLLACECRTVYRLLPRDPLESLDGARKSFGK
jgi:hypothetical protein